MAKGAAVHSPAFPDDICHNRALYENFLNI